MEKKPREVVEKKLIRMTVKIMARRNTTSAAKEILEALKTAYQIGYEDAY